MKLLGIAVVVVIGLVVLVSFLRGAMAQRKGADELPKVAEALGLDFSPSPNPEKTGRITGRFAGRDVSLRPDNFGLIRVALEQKNPVHLVSQASDDEPPDLPVLETGDIRFDASFPVRHGDEVARDRLTADSELRTMLVGFVKRWGPKLGTLTVAADDLSVQKLDDGMFQMHHSLPAEHLEEILTELVAIADRLEQTLH